MQETPVDGGHFPVGEGLKQDQFYPWSFTGKGMDYFLLLLSNALLSIVTLGIYAAWAKVRRNRYLYGHTRIAGEAFEYHATGLMIFKGRLIVIGVLTLAALPQFFVHPAFSLLPSVVFIIALPWVLNQSFRFRARMLSWRNVHFRWCGTTLSTLRALWPFVLILLLLVVFSLFFLEATTNRGRFDLKVVEGSIGQHFALVLSFYIVVILLGFYGFFCWARYASNQFCWGNIRLGSAFGAWDYFRIVLVGVVVFVLLLVGFVLAADVLGALTGHSIMGFWQLFLVSLLIVFFLLSITVRYMIRNTIVSQAAAWRESPDGQQVKTAYFYSNIKWLKTTFFHLQNAMAVVLSIGLLYPWVVVRSQRYLAERTAVVFVEDMQAVVDQTQQEVSAVASEYADLDGIDISPW